MKLSKEYWFIVIMGALSGLIIFIGQILTSYGFSTFEMTIIPYSLAVILMLPIVIYRRQWRTKKNIGPLLLWGLIVALSGLSEFGGLVFHIPVAVIVLLLYTQPLRTIVLRYIFSREQIFWFHIIAAILVLAGVIFLVYPFGGGLILNTTGVMIGLIGGLFMSLRVIIGGRVGRKNIDPYLANFSGIFFGIIILGILLPIVTPLIHTIQITSFSLHWPPIVRFWCIIFAVFPQVIGHILYLRGIKKVSIVSAGIILLIEPLIATILATLFLHQPLTIYMIIGGLLILGGNVFVMIYGQKGSEELTP